MQEHTDPKVERKVLMECGSWVPRYVGHFELDRNTLNAMDPIEFHLIVHLRRMPNRSVETGIVLYSPPHCYPAELMRYLRHNIVAGVAIQWRRLRFWDRDDADLVTTKQTQFSESIFSSPQIFFICFLHPLIPGCLLHSLTEPCFISPQTIFSH